MTPLPPHHRSAGVVHLAALVAFSCLALPSKVVGQITFDGCTDANNVPVASVRNDHIQDVAIATRSPTGDPIILYNVIVLSWLQPPTRLFFYAHECAHHVLRHVVASPSLTAEREADCWAIRALKKRGDVDAVAIGTIQADISRAGRGDWSHLPGPMRAVDLGRCLQGPGGAASSIANLAQATLLGPAGVSTLRGGSLTGMECKYDTEGEALHCSQRLTRDDAPDAYEALLEQARVDLEGWEEEESPGTSSATQERVKFTRDGDAATGMIFVVLGSSTSSGTQRVSIRFTFITND